jgi:hypothetical protein
MTTSNLRMRSSKCIEVRTRSNQASPKSADGTWMTLSGNSPPWANIMYIWFSSTSRKVSVRCRRFFSAQPDMSSVSEHLHVVDAQLRGKARSAREGGAQGLGNAATFRDVSLVNRKKIDKWRSYRVSNSDFSFRPNQIFPPPISSSNFPNFEISPPSSNSALS